MFKVPNWSELCAIILLFMYKVIYLLDSKTNQTPNENNTFKNSEKDYLDEWKACLAGQNTQHILISFYHFIVIECCHSGLMQVLGYTQAPDGRLKLRLIIWT